MSNLEFHHPTKHSLEQLQWIDDQLKKTKLWKLIDALRMAHQLVIHHHPATKIFIDQMREISKSILLHNRLDQLYEIHVYMQRYEPSKLKNQKDIFDRLYDPNEFQYIKSKTKTKKLLIVFTTIYNNFGISNLLLYSILRQKDCSILFVKDPTYGCYMARTKVGNNLNDLVLFLQKFINDAGNFSEYQIMGYSSSGYASWYVANKLGVKKFLGFSLATNFSTDTSLPTESYLKPSIRNQIDKSQLLNLATMQPKNPNMKSRLVVGELEHVDRMHAENMSSFKGLEIDILPKTFHDTPEASIQMGLFEGYLDWLLD